MTAFVSSEVVAELVNTPPTKTKGERRQKLLNIVLGGVLIKHEPTRVPMVGGRPPLGCTQIRRRYMLWSTPAPPEAAVLLSRLRSLKIRKLDGVHLVEAALADADAFVPMDKEDLLKRHEEIKSATGVEVMRPEEVLRRLGR